MALVSAFAAALVLIVATAASPRPAAPGPLHIHALQGSVVRLGTMNGYRLLGVRLKATVCVRSGQEALKVYPSEIGVTHFVVTSSRKRWRAVRLTRDRAPWLVPLGETWNGRACGPVVIDDPIPPTHYGVESLGNPQSCYGTALSLTVMRRTATKRTVVRCGGVG